jgi:hypothetical protein
MGTPFGNLSSWSGGTGLTHTACANSGICCNSCAIAPTSTL